jgi:hypothetical protein
MRFAILTAAFLAATPVVAKEITVKFSEEELRVQHALNEIALKTAGDQSVDAYVALRAKYKAAIEEASKPVEPKK